METTIPIIETALPYNAVILPQPEQPKPEPTKQNNSKKIWYVLIGALFIAAFLGALITTPTHTHTANSIVQTIPSITTQIIRFLDGIGLGQGDLGVTDLNTSTIDQGKNTTTINQGKNTTTTTIQPTTTIPIIINQTNKTFSNATINATLATLEATYNDSIVLTDAQQFNATTLSDATSLSKAEADTIYDSLKQYKGSKLNTSIIIQNITKTVPYGTLQDKSGYVLPSSTDRYVVYGNHSAVFYTVNTTKANPALTIDIAGATLTTPNQTMGVNPIIMPFGNHTNQWHLIGSFTGGTVGGNKLQWDYSIIVTNITSNTTSKLMLGSLFAENISIPYDYWLNATDRANVTLDEGGNANYSKIDPSGVVTPNFVFKYVPYTITNVQNTPTHTGLPILMTVNSLRFKQFEAPDLSNQEWFYANGSLVVSDMMLNVSNTATATGIWIKLNPSLPANYGNIIVYQGFAVLTKNLLNTVSTGEFANVSVLEGNTYGLFDTGNVLFNQYDNFAGTTLNTNLWSCGGSGCTQNSGITVLKDPVLSCLTTYGLQSVQTFSTTNETLDTYTITGMPSAGTSVPYSQVGFGFGDQCVPNLNNNREGYMYESGAAPPVWALFGEAPDIVADAYSIASSYNGLTNGGGTLEIVTNTLLTSNAGTANAYFTQYGGANVANTLIRPHSTGNAIISYEVGGAGSGTMILNTAYVRWSYPNNVKPTITQGNIINFIPTPLYVINLSVSQPSGTLAANTPIEWNLPMNTYNNIITNGFTNVVFANTLNKTVLSGFWGFWAQNLTSNTQAGATIPLWFRVPYAISQGTATNIIEMWVLQTGAGVLDGNLIGAPSYATGGACNQYDNGANVFQIYLSACSTTNTLSNLQWISRNIIVGNGITLANQVTAVTLDFNGVVSSGNVLEIYGGFQTTSTNNKGSTAINGLGQSNPQLDVLQAGFGTTGISTGTASSVNGRNLIVTYGISTTNQVIGMWSNGITVFTTNRVINNATIVGAGFNSKSSNVLPTGVYPINVLLNAGNVGSGSTQFIQWIRDRLPPTNNKMPSVLTGGEDVGIVITNVAPNPANNYDSGQSIPFTVYWTGGVGVFTANYQIYNTISGVVIANALYTNIAGGTASNTFAWTLPSRIAWGNTIAVNVTISDGIFTASSNSPTQHIFVNFSNIPTLYPQRNITLDFGQNVTLNSDIGQIFGFSSGAVFGVNSTLANVYISNGIHLDRVGMACTGAQETQVAGWSASNYIILGIGFGQGCGNIINLPDWNASIANVIGLYPTVHQWEVLNEPTNTKQGYNNDQAANIFNLTRAATITIKKLQPNSTVVCGGGLKLDIIANVVDYNVAQYMVANGILSNCDAFSLHSYFGNGRNYTFVQPSGNTIQSDVDLSLNRWHTLLGNTPIWITETGVVGNILGGASSTLVTPTNQVAFMTQAFTTLTNRSFVDKIFWYAGAGFGCLYNGTLGTTDYAPKPCFNEFLYWNNHTGAPPYSFNYIVSNAINGAKVANALYGGITMPYNSFVWTPSGSAVNKVFHAQLTITDSASTAVVRNSLFTQLIYINPTLVKPTITGAPAPSTIYSGNTVAFNAVWSGGTSPYTVQFKISNTITGIVLANQTYIGITATSNVFNWTVPIGWNGNTLQANVIVIDNATTPTSANSVMLKTYTVSLAPQITLSVPTNPLKYGNTETITFQPNAVASSDYVELLINNAIVSAATSGGGTYTFNNVAWTPVGVYTLNAFDVNSLASNVISLTVSRAPPTLTCSFNGNTFTTNGLIFNSILASAYANCTNGSFFSQLTPRFRYNGATVIFNALENFNSIWNDSNNQVIWNNAQTTNYLANSLTFNINYVRYLIVSNTVPAGTVYETASNFWTWVYNITKAATSANFVISYQNVNVTGSTVSIQPTQQTINNFYRAPLVSTNGLIVTYNAFIQLSFANGTLKSNPINTIKQTVLQNYFPTTAVAYSNIILGENQTVYINISDISNLNATTYSGTLKVGTHTPVSEFQTSSNTFYGNLNSFIPSDYGLTNPGFIGTVNIPVNAVIQLSVNGISVYRNLSTSFMSTFQAVGNCNTTFPTNTITWKFFNSNDLLQYNSNVFITGYFQIIKNTWAYNTINGTNAGFPPVGTANSPTYQTCIFPSWAGGHHSFQASGQFNFNASISAAGHYYFVKQTLSNVPQTINLYLQYIPSPELYNIAVKNVTTGSFVASLIQVLQFIPNSNTSVLVNELQSTAVTPAQTYLSIGTQYRFGVYNPTTGQLRKLTGYTIIASCVSPPCTIIIPVGNTNITDIGSYVDNIHQNCTQSPAQSIGNPSLYNITITCTFSSVNGTTYNGTLTVVPNTFLNNTITCQKSVSGASGSMACTVSHTNNTAYHWQFTASAVLGQTLLLNQGAFGYSSLPFTKDGLLIAFLIILVLGFLFMPKNAIVTIILIDIGVIGSWLLQVLPTGVNIYIIGGLQLLVLVLLWLVSRG